MEKEKFIITDAQLDTRLDVLIGLQLPEISRTRATELIRDGLVRVNGQLKKAKYRPTVGEEVEVMIPEVESFEILAQDLNLNIVYEDAHVAVVNKPTGMVVHPSLGHQAGTLVNGLLFAIKDLSGIKGQKRPGIVHRIDKDTSGLLMIAKHDKAHESLSDQLKAKTVKREYVALVHGMIDHDLGKIDAPIGRDPSSRTRNEVVENGKDAVTHFQVLARFDKYTLVKCRLETGRTHQIRVHMRYIGHSLVGDPLYGPRKTKKSDFGQYLHARSLGFNHPETGEYMEFASDLPDEFKDFLAELK